MPGTKRISRLPPPCGLSSLLNDLCTSIVRCLLMPRRDSAAAAILPQWRQTYWWSGLYCTLLKALADQAIYRYYLILCMSVRLSMIICLSMSLFRLYSRSFSLFFPPSFPTFLHPSLSVCLSMFFNRTPCRSSCLCSRICPSTTIHRTVICCTLNCVCGY